MIESDSFAMLMIRLLSIFQQNLTEESIFHYADEFFVSLNLTRVPPSFWNLSVFKKIPDRHMACHPTAFDMYKHDDVRSVFFSFRKELSNGFIIILVIDV